MNEKSPIGIIGAMPQEIEIITKLVHKPQIKKIAGMPIISGKINDVFVVIMQCNIGKVNAAIGTTLMIEHYKPRAIINTGSAGSISKYLNMGDIVIGESVMHHDVDITAFGYDIGQIANMPKNYPCDSLLVRLTKQSATAIADTVIHHGQIVSGDQFIANKERLNVIKKTFPKALAVEMEAAAIAQSCYCFRVPFVAVRAISDLANEHASTTFDKFIEQASKHSAQMVIDLLDLLKVK